MHFDRKLRIAGVIINNVAGKRHADYITDALARTVRVPIVGVIPRNSEIKMEERHLGLVPMAELEEAKRKAITVHTAKYIADCLDIDKVLSLCSTTTLPDALDRASCLLKQELLLPSMNHSTSTTKTILMLWKGAERQLVYFSPVWDKELPEETNGIILGGGFPEVLADQLEKNRFMIKSIRRAVEAGMPIYGECGGFDVSYSVYNWLQRREKGKEDDWARRSRYTHDKEPYLKLH